ncbi:MAG: hypothetical protein GJ677_08280 [Rhodobacteraceae bacterium]|nr:hypothetical protein [Paracoccaceae bacterium]
MDGIRIHGNLFVNTSTQSPVKWQSDGFLSLRGARIGSIVGFGPKDWRRLKHQEADSDVSAEKLAYEPLPIDITGQAYDQVLTSLWMPEAVQAPQDNPANGEFISPVLSMTNAVVPSVSQLVSWIEAGSVSGAKIDEAYNPQPYQQLATTLRNMGDEAAAKEVIYHRYAHRMATRPDTFSGWLSWLSDCLFWSLTWFGTYPFLPLAWMALLIGAGTAVGHLGNFLDKRRCHNEAQTLDAPFWYSIENALPLVELSPEYRNVVHAGWRRVFFHCQKLRGFVLATVLVGALSLISS